MRRLWGLVVGLLLVGLASAQSPGWLQWSKADDLAGPDAVGPTGMVSAAPDGSVYVLLLDGPSRLLHFDSTGHLLWSRDYGMADSSLSRPFETGSDISSLAATADGAYVALAQEREYPYGGGMAMMRYDADGNLKWVKYHEGLPMGQMVGAEVTADQSGNAVFLATNDDPTEHLVGQPAHNTFYKFTPTGTQLWTYRLGYTEIYDFQCGPL
jgi:outer membrane protein assembly factor BamB